MSEQSQADAKLALLAMYAEDMYRPLLCQEPAWDPRLLKDWRPVGYLTATDALLRKGATAGLGGQRVYYGFLAESRTFGGTFALVVRGTDGILEWIEDAEYSRRAHPEGGQVEAGFWGIYQTMMYRDPKGKDCPLVPALSKAISTGRCYVIGHSLGAALAAYLAVDLSPALIAGRTALRVFASPHPGDSAFARLVADRVDCRGYAYEPDLVPRVPPFMGYCALPNRVIVSPGDALARIKMNLYCNHHALSYAAMLDPSSLKAAAPTDQAYVACVRI